MNIFAILSILCVVIAVVLCLITLFNAYRILIKHKKRLRIAMVAALLFATATFTLGANILASLAVS